MRQIRTISGAWIVISGPFISADMLVEASIFT